MFIPGSINIGGSGIYGNVLSTNITNGKIQPIKNLIDTTVVPSTHDMSDIIGQGKGTLYCEFNCTSQIDEVGLLTLCISNQFRCIWCDWSYWWGDNYRYHW